MIVGQTVFSVRKGTEHRAETALHDLDGLLRSATGHQAHRVLRSFGMSPIGSALHDETREGELGAIHYVVQTEWESLESHDDFYRGDAASRVYAVLSSILNTGPYEVLYDVLEQADRSGVAA
jgi:heme-degrading monooxygenase HmoA